MKKIANISLFALLALLLHSGAAHAYQTWSSGGTMGARTGNCATCHGDFFSPAYTSRTGDDGVAWGTNLMSGHQTMGTGAWACTDCHNSGGFATVNLNASTSGITCSSCHGRTQDGPATGGLGVSKAGAGLRKYHELKVGTGTCSGCHSGDPATPVAENIAPPTFLTKSINPCSDRFFGTAGLDNDGNGQRDGADAACGAPPPPTAPNIQVSPLASNFGNVTVGNSVDRTVTIANTGNASLTNISAALALTSNPGFSIVTPPPATIAANQSADVILRYTATDVATASGKLEIKSNDPDTPLVTVSLTANGACAALLECRVNVSPTALDFGTLIQGNSNTKAVTISNQGTAACNVTAVLTGSADFSGTPAGVTVAPGGSQAINVMYKPSNVGGDAGTLDLNSNDTTQPLVIVSLSGTGEAAPPPPPVGQVAYNSNCGFCHGDPKTGGAAPNAQFKVAGARVCSINVAIFGNPGVSTSDSPYPAGVPGMQFLRSLSSQAIQDISTYLNSFAVTGQQRYVTACAGCHGIDARGGYTREDVRGKDGSSIREYISGESAMRFLSCLPRSDTDQMGSYLRTLR